jgi:hypothetical protein
MTTMRWPAPTQEGGTERRGSARRGNAVILVLLLTFALAALAASAVMLSSGARNVVKFHNSEQDLRYTADASLGLGVSDLENNPYRLPTSGYIQLATNANLAEADSAPVSGITYNLWAGLTGSASLQHGRFVTLVTQTNDSLHHRSFVRREEFVEETFAKFAYYSEQENGICFGSGDRLTGPIFSNSAISSCAGQKAEFMDSVETASTFTNGNPSIDTLYKPPARQFMTPIQLPSTSKLNTLYTLAASGNTQFDAGYTQNANTDTTAKAKQRLEFVAWRVNSTDPDSTVPGSGFVKYYAVGRSNAWWTGASGGALPAADVDSAQSDYLRAGLLHHMDPLNCGDWHWVKNDAGVGEWEFFSVYAHGLTNFENILLTGDKEKGRTGVPTTLSGWMAAAKRPVIDTILSWGWTTTAAWQNIPSGVTTAGTQPAATCFPGGDPHLVMVERMGATQAGLAGYTTARPPAAGTGLLEWQKGGTDTTFTPTGTLGTWSKYSGSPAYPSFFTTNHPDYQYLYPIDTVYNKPFTGVIAVYGTVAISGNVNGHITVYTDGSAAMIDDLRLTTSTGDTACTHGMGIVAGQYILPADNGINMEQHTLTNTYVSLRQHNGGPISNDLYIQSTVMALQSWGAEQLTPDSAYNVDGALYYGVGAGTSGGPALCNGSYYIRGCVWVWGSIIQYGRVTINGCGGDVSALPSTSYNTNWGCGYAKQYQYDQCAVVNPLPYFPTTGRYSPNAYYEDDPTKFNVDSLFKVLAPPAA